MKKFLLFAILVITLTLTLSVSAFATDEVPENESATETESGEKENAFAEIYALTVDNIDKVFSALAFVSSLLLALAYRRGLIPIINTGLSAIKKNADSFEGAMTESLDKTETSLNFLTDKFASCMNGVEQISEYLTSLTERLDLIESKKDNAKVLKTVMLSQIDMLYEIFMNSALPQYSKDALGERVSEMKKSIACGEEND